MTNANDTQRDLSQVTGGSARKIYETTQELIKKNQLSSEMSITRTNQFHAPFDFLFVKEGFNIREGLNEEKIRMFAELFKSGKYVPPIEVIAVVLAASKCWTGTTATMVPNWPSKKAQALLESP